MHPLAKLDHHFIWHPFTQMRDWFKREPIVIVSGRGAVLRDAKGREYLDANSSIWTNLHGHNHPKLNGALQRQLNKIAHSSALGLANEPASLLAAELVKAAEAKWGNGKKAPALGKVFFSDDGSTALEVALKLAHEFTRRTRGSKSPRFISLDGAYHGDTVGAVSLGHIDLFHKAYSGLLFKSDKAPAPYCYRCPHNRAKPDRADAREYRKCNWECLGTLDRLFAARKKRAEPYAAFVVEPLIQGAAGMIPQPAGWLRGAAELARAHGALLIADEVMTGFGRTGMAVGKVGTWESGKVRQGAFLPLSHFPTFPLSPPSLPLFACHHEQVQPDFLCLAKGLTGGYLPMAATLTTPAVFNAFLGEHGEFKTFFHGHSFTGNQLGAAASLASLSLLQTAGSIRKRMQLQTILGEELESLWSLPNVGDIRKVGLVAGVELVKAPRTRARFHPRERAGIRVCEAMARRGVLTRPIGDVIVVMPPYCTTPAQMRRIVRTLREACDEVFG